MFFGTSGCQPCDQPSLLMNNIDLKSYETFDNLGLQLDTDLSFEAHMSHTLANCNFRLTTLCKIRKYIDQRVAIRIYKSIMLAKLQYGFSFLTNCSSRTKKMVQHFQNKALHVCCLGNRYTSNHELHHQNNVLPIELRCKTEVLNLMYKLAHRRNSPSLEDESDLVSQSNYHHCPQTRLRSGPVLLTVRNSGIQLV